MTTNSLNQRMTAEIDGEPVLFLTGMRINAWWKPHVWLSIMGAMTGMLRELEADPERGLLSHHMWMGRTIIVLQYWKSYAHLEAYARDRASRHVPAWARFAKRIAGSGDVGVWHETYAIEPGSFETVYTDMPNFGLAKAMRAVPVTTSSNSARERMGRRPTEAQHERAA